MSVPSQSFFLINAFNCIIEYDCDYGKSIYMNDVFLLYYWRGGNDCYYLTKDTKVFSYFNKPLCWNIINLGLQAEALKTIKTNLKSI